MNSVKFELTRKNFELVSKKFDFLGLKLFFFLTCIRVYNSVQFSFHLIVAKFRTTRPPVWQCQKLGSVRNKQTITFICSSFHTENHGKSDWIFYYGHAIKFAQPKAALRFSRMCHIWRSSYYCCLRYEIDNNMVIVWTVWIGQWHIFRVSSCKTFCGDPGFL